MKAKLLLLLLLFTFITFAQQTKPLCVSDTGQTNVKAHNTANVAPQVIYLKSESEKKDWSDIWLPIFAALLVTIGAYMGVLKQSKASSISGFRVNWIEDLRVSYSKFLIALRNVDNKIRNGTIDPNNYSKDDDEEDLQFLKTKIKLLLNHNPLRNPDHVEFYSCLLLYMEEHKDYYRGQPSDEKLQALDKRKAEMEEVLLNILKSEWEKAKKFT
ncbi:MAG: hypothetical protein KIS69_11375 [Bacteroidetes bacterium]|nr:hypothetical protein [Bacteroidota bacterium]